MGKKVLAVDDSRSIVELVRHVLERNNFEVATAANGAQALDKYVRFQPNVVLLDVSMPIMDGYETMARILKIDPHAAIIMLTAIENPDNMLRFLQRGAKAYLVKPIKNQELIETINQISDPSYDKHLRLFFRQVNGRLDQSIKKMLDPTASVVLKDVNVTSEQRSPQADLGRLDFPRIESVQKIAQPLMIDRREGTIGYVTEFNSVLHGIIVSFIDEKDLHYIVSIQNNKDEQEDVDGSGEAEFFNIINMKVLSELSNYLNTKLLSTTRPFDEDKDASPPYNEFLKANFEISFGAKSMPLEVQLWLNMEHVFGSKIRSMML